MLDNLRCLRARDIFRRSHNKKISRERTILFIYILTIYLNRLLLDRMIGLKLPLKKMKFFFKRYIDFETVHGDASRLKTIKEKAQNYLSSNQED